MLDKNNNLQLKREGEMVKHYITKYVEDGKRYAEAWIQINIFGYSICFWKRKVEI